MQSNELDGDCNVFRRYPGVRGYSVENLHWKFQMLFSPSRFTTLFSLSTFHVNNRLRNSEDGGVPMSRTLSRYFSPRPYASVVGR